MALFGTDGIRGAANKYPLDCETILKVGRAIAEYFRNNDGANKILIGCDTRISASMVSNAIAIGICSMGVNVVFAGVLPTPGVACLTAKGDFCAGVAISGSHNKFSDNGVKLFDENGCKLNSFIEQKLEKIVADSNLKNRSSMIQHVGRIQFYEDPLGIYKKILKDSCPQSYSLEGMKIVLDCSNGATSICAPELFRELGAQVTAVFCSPNGVNINDSCGSENTKTIANIVISEKADLGLAYDGDGDRLTAISELGEALNGDQLITILANDLMKRGSLNNKIVVSTIMSNLGLGFTLKKIGLKHIKSKIGDKHVIEKMLAYGADLGGENSGHIIFRIHHNIGDAMFTSLRLIDAIRRCGLPLSELAKIMTITPQHLVNIDVKSKPDISKVPTIHDAILTVKKNIGDNGRVLVRYSGTEMQCRIMIEGNDLDKVKNYCLYLSEVISNHLDSL